jgi:alpha-glucosidase (family GH31 glycosyl hydrolase)
MDLRVTLWIHPFINLGKSKYRCSLANRRHAVSLICSIPVLLECPSFLTAVEGQYLVKDQNGKPGITSWWQGTHSGIVDYTNTEAADWWRARLELLRTQFGIDAGETNWLPYSHQLTGDDARTPNLYTTKYVEALAPFGGMIEVRSGRRNQVNAAA